MTAWNRGYYWGCFAMVCAFLLCAYALWWFGKLHVTWG